MFSVFSDHYLATFFQLSQASVLNFEIKTYRITEVSLSFTSLVVEHALIANCRCSREFLNFWPINQHLGCHWQSKQLFSYT